MKPTIYDPKDEPATQAELTSACRTYVATVIFGREIKAGKDIDKYIHYVWGNIIHDGWDVSKADVIQAVSEIIEYPLEYSH